MSSTDRYLIKPSITLHPKGSLKDPFNQLHSKNFNQLFSFIKTCQNKEFWDELNVLEKLYYKNKNQHKRSEYFHKIVEEMNFYESFLHFIAIFYGKEKSFDINKIDESNWNHVPSQEMVSYILNRLIGGTLLMNKNDNDDLLDNEFPDSLEEIKSIQQSL
ncbi:13199_t:CDS:2 [Entrophospora sp. SA101]|nr:13199_t:CDS:2 [Entrophospora sp. SA101]